MDIDSLMLQRPLGLLQLFPEKERYLSAILIKMLKDAGPNNILVLQLKNKH